MGCAKQLACLLAVAAFVGCAVAEDSLQIGVKYRPDKCDEKAKNGDYVSVHYTGRLTDGTEFDSSIPRGEPISFELGSGRVIAGWEQGILGMCVGEKRKLRIPPHLGYGEQGAGPIPGGATLVFDVELVRISEVPEQGDGYPGYNDYPYGGEGGYGTMGGHDDVEITDEDDGAPFDEVHHLSMEDMQGMFDMGDDGEGGGYGDEDDEAAHWS